jgi:hypothetical protein
MTYAVDGRQYIAVAVGAKGLAGRIDRPDPASTWSSLPLLGWLRAK